MKQMKQINIEKQELFTFAAILAASILLFWWRIWAPSPTDRMHFSGDILIKDFPTRLGLLRLWLQGSFPLWDPYLFGGWPGFANCEAGLLYPFNWLLFPFVNAPVAGYQVAQWTILLHFWLLGMGAFVLARKVGLAPLGAAMTAVAFTFCGFHCAHKQHTNMFYTLTWFPWIMLHVEYWIRYRTPRALVYVTLLLVLAFFAGHPQAILYMILIIFARFIHGTLTHQSESVKVPQTFKQFFRHMLPVLITLGFVIGLTAIQWVPLWELIQQGERANADAFESSIEFSLPPIELVDMILPDVIGSWVEVYYWGIVPLLLTILAIRLCVLDHFFKFLFILSIVAIFLSLGDHFFLFDLSYVLVPGVAWVRAPSRWIYFASLPIALFAGLAINWLMDQQQNAYNTTTTKIIRNISIAWVALLGLIAYILLMFIDEGSKQRFIQVFFIQMMVSIIFLVTLILYSQRKLSLFVLSLIAIGLTWFDLGTHYRIIDLRPGKGGFTTDSTAEFIQEANWNSRTKIFLASGEIRNKYHGSAQNFNELDGNSPLTPQLNLHLRKDSAIELPMAYNANLLNLLGTGIIITDHEAIAQPYTKVGEDTFIHDKPTARARVYSNYLAVDSETQRDILKIQSFPFDQVLLRLPESERVTPVEPENETEEFEMPSPWLSKPFLLTSASKQAVQAQAMLIVDGKNHFEDMGNEPGYYLAQADPNTGEIERTLQLNLMSSAAHPKHPAHVNLQEFIRTVPEGKTVFAAISDNAANVLLAEGLSAFQQIGAKLDVRTGYQEAHAIIGRKGAPIGSALEIVSPTEAFVLQTKDYFRVSGTQTKPINTVRYFGTTQHVKEWNQLWETLYAQTDSNKMIRLHTEPGSAILPFPVRIHSVPKKTNLFDFDEEVALIEIGGKNFSPNDTGYNIVTIDPSNWQIVDQENFNLLQDYDPSTNLVADPPVENQRMQQFLDEVPNGYYVLGAIKDEAIDLMQTETLNKLQQLGSKLYVDLSNPSLRKQWSHAFIFIKGSNTFVETFGQNTDSLIVSRYPGGPMLLGEDFDLPNANYHVQAPLDEWRALVDQQDRYEHEAAPIWSVKDDGANHLIISGMSEKGGILLLNEIYYPGWTASLVGFDLPVERVNYYFRGVAIPSGGQIVEFHYRPDSFTNGLIVSFVSLLLFILYLNWLRKQVKST